MKKHFKPAYYFTATPGVQPEVLSMSLVGVDPAEFKNGNSEKIPGEILMIQSWDFALLNLSNEQPSITGYSKDCSFFRDVIRFHSQRDNLLFGEACDSNKAILACMYGSRDENGILIPEILSVSVSNIRFNNINVFNYPTTEHARCWDEALNAKWKMANENAA